MIDIFAELYNKVMNFFQNDKGENTKEMASNRLKLVLMHDRTKLDPLTIEKMRLELIDVISKYVVIDKDLLELNLAGEGNSIALMLNIPVVRAKTEEELAELKAQEEAGRLAKEAEEKIEAEEVVDEENIETEEEEIEPAEFLETIESEEENSETKEDEPEVENDSESDTEESKGNDSDKDKSESEIKKPKN